MTIWLACHGKLATKDRLHKFGMVENTKCCFCGKMEYINHLFFYCDEMNRLWMRIIDWIQITHVSKVWDEKILCLVDCSKGKGFRAPFSNLRLPKTIYGIWNYRNDKSFGQNVTNPNQNVTNPNLGDKNIDTIVYRGWYSGNIENI